MGVVQGLSQPADDLGGLLECRPVLFQPDRQRSAVDQLAGDVELAVGFAGVVDGYNVGMLELGGGTRFAEEALGFLAVGVIEAWNLQRDIAVEVRVISSPNFAEGTFAQRRTQLKAAETTKRGVGAGPMAYFPG